MNVNIKKLDPRARTPVYATDGSGAFDLWGFEPVAFETRGFHTVVVRTGLSFAIPLDHVMLIFSRSGQGFKDNTRLANCVGVIDSDYRGEVMVKLVRDDGWSLTFDIDKAVAQALILPIPRVTFTEVEELDSTARGEGGFGSTDLLWPELPANAGLTD